MPTSLALLALLGVLHVTPPVEMRALPVDRVADGADSYEAEPEDADALPVSVERIKRQLAQLPPSANDWHRVSYYIEVYGKAPVLNIFHDADLVNGPVRYAAPTHRQFLQLVTPEQFRSPAVNLGAPMQALIQWLMKQVQKR